jgi:pimeloyl-ACP methyl ester carboxylesterase
MLGGGPGVGAKYMDTVTSVIGDKLDAIRYDQRGPGETDAASMSPARDVADAMAILDHEHIQKAWLVGHSWGGYLALQIARAHPERVAGIIDVDGLGAVGGGGWSQMDVNLEARETPQQRVNAARFQDELDHATTDPDRDRIMAAMVKDTWNTYFADPRHAPPAPDDLTTSVSIYNADTQVWQNDVAAHARGAGLEDALPHIAVPTLFVHGAEDPLPLGLSAQPTAARMPNAQVAVIPNAGHMGWLEQPAAFHDAVAGFVAAHSAPRA